MFFPCLLRSRPRCPLPGASETAWDRCSGGTGSESRTPGDACKEGSRQGIAPAAGSGAGMGFGGGDSVSRDMENRTAPLPPQPAQRDRASPATSDLQGKHWGAPGLAFPHPTASSAPKPMRDVVKAPLRDAVGNAFPGCAGRVLLCPRDTFALELASLHCLDISPGAVWLGLFPSHVLAPKDIRIPLSIPMRLWGHPSAGLGSKPSSH